MSPTLLAATDPITQMHEPWAAHDTRVVIVAVAGIALVVLLILLVKMHAFLALTIASLFVGIASGIGLTDVAGSYEDGVGAVLGNVGVLIALGAMLGKLLADSGGADAIVERILHGSRRSLPWRMALIAFIVGIPMFFEIGLVLLIPVVMLAVRRARVPAMLLAVPALAGLSVLHGFIPPHPGPLAAIANLNASLGITLALGLIVAVPTVIIAGPLFAQLAARWVPIGAAGAAGGIIGAHHDDAAPGQGVAREGAAKEGAAGEGGAEAPEAGAGIVTVPDDTGERRGRPSFAWTLTTILTPVVLMLIRAAADIWMSEDNAVYPFLEFIGTPIVALLISVLLAMVTFGTAVGFTTSTLSTKIGDSLKPIVGVLLIVGAGGGFKQVLVDGGTGVAIGKIAVALSLSALVLGWIVAVLIRLATGSATVATITASGIVAPLASDLSSMHLSLVVLAVGAGSVIFSFVNDAGFWLVKEYFGMTIGQTVKTWSTLETIIAVVGLAITGALWVVT